MVGALPLVAARSSQGRLTDVDYPPQTERNPEDRQKPMRLRMEDYIRRKQKEIVAALEEVDGATFRTDSWSRPNNGGGGVTRVLQDGNVFEEAGVNISIVHGKLNKAAAEEMRQNHKNVATDDEQLLDFYALGLSMVVHPKNPMAPTVHMNGRYFETARADGSSRTAWFGGGSDLTPSYLFEEDAEHFHATLKAACDEHDAATAGSGAVSGEKEWQQVRRGRYVEFNLVYDRGTAFGLNVPGLRVESILISLPVTAQWRYMHDEPEADSREGKLLAVLRIPKAWV
ncbi:coproporphyrinogen III oxidase [Colletotrichum sojae]|uniref:coproporphyrinogen oxidase n=1 Tax=Colletotrichum sojae TaxID=2175907 RepID=A0A8H6MYU6_9PEZI|nr:coproporphyrinogen III oxidase [Colletotrichum sojae]